MFTANYTDATTSGWLDFCLVIISLIFHPLTPSAVKLNKPGWVTQVYSVRYPLIFFVHVCHFEIYLGTSPKTVTPKRTPSSPTTLFWKEETMAEMKSFTLEKLVWPTLHDSSTRKTMSACNTVLHAEGRRMI